MKQRIITAIVLVALFLPCVIVSGIPFKILMAFIGVMATYELLSITKEPKPHFYLYIVLGAYILGSLFFSKGLLVSNMFIVIYMVILLTCGIFDAGMPFLRISYYFTSATLVALGLHAIYYFKNNDNSTGSSYGNKANSLMDEAIQYQNARNKLVNDNPNLFR